MFKRVLAITNVINVLVMIDIEKVKLVIWDLDDTFWSGTLSEGTIELISSNIQLVKDLTDIGVVNTICSKNSYDEVEKQLKTIGLFDYFVFPSISWTPKGERIKFLLKQMSLREANALFIDDNNQNLEEALFYNPELMVSDVTILKQLQKFVSLAEKKDISHKRLKQYKILEIKCSESLKYVSNEEFLYASNIHVDICHDCINHIDRICELVLRTNQLNYTKKRETKEELLQSIETSDEAGYIKVYDKFGDYGIVGFYLLKDYCLKHFLFSCRTIGQGVEQYVYAQLNFPDIVVIGDVYVEVEKGKCPSWINNKAVQNESNAELLGKSCSVLLKGPCDLSSVYGYLNNKNNLVCEFTYVVDNGMSIESHNHSVGISALLYSDDEKANLIEDCIFIDKTAFDSELFRRKFDVIFLSTLSELNLGIYKKKGSNMKIAFGEWVYPLTDSRYWDQYVNGEIFTSGVRFSYSFLKDFSSKYEFIGRTNIDDYLSFIDMLLSKLDRNVQLYLMLGSEIQYLNNKQLVYKNRHMDHLKFNEKIKEYCSSNKKVHYIDITKSISNGQDYVGNINHFTPRVYYQLALRISKILNEEINQRQINFKASKLHIISHFFEILKIQLVRSCHKILKRRNL